MLPYPLHLHVHLLDFMSALPPALFPGISFCSLLPLLFSPPSLLFLFSSLLKSEYLSIIRVQSSAIFLTSSPSSSEHIRPLCWLCPLCVPVLGFQWPVNSSSYTSHKSTATQMARTEWLQTDLISLVFPHFLSMVL